MSDEIEKNIDKDNGTEKPYYPYVLWKLFSTWLVALFLILFIFPNFLRDMYPVVGTLTLLGMIIYTIYFFLKRSSLLSKKKIKEIK